MAVIVIDGKNAILGRLASAAAKRALNGDEVHVVNCNDIVVTGRKNVVFAEYKRKRSMGAVRKGPFFPREAHRMVERTIRGMVPHKIKKGRDAMKKIRCYRLFPKELEGKELVKVEGADVSKVKNITFMRIGEISKLLGAKR